MRLFSLEESLARSKNRLKKWMNIGLKSSSPTTLVGQDVWPSIRALLDQLDSSAEVFGPIKSAINGLVRLVDAYEIVYQEKSEYKELRKNIDQVLKDISVHMKRTTRNMMTDSVKLICSDIEKEVAIMQKKQQMDIGRRTMSAMEGQEGVMYCSRQVHAYLERLKLNLNLSILEGIDELMLEMKLTKMSPSMSATYNSAESIGISRKGCTQGTRQPQIDLLLEWARTPDAGKTCWMNGMA
ncbi:unnamed protein product, partial [Rhizoctonia solani]